MKVAACGSLQRTPSAIHNHLGMYNKIFQRSAKIARSSQTESKVRIEDEVRTECQIVRRSRDLRMIFATLFTKVICDIVQCCQSSQHCSKRNAKRLERRYGEAWLPLLPVPDPLGGGGMVKSGVQAAFTMVSVGYREATSSWVVIVFP